METTSSGGSTGSSSALFTESSSSSSQSSVTDSLKDSRIVSKVLKRAELAKIRRTLDQRLALASYKVQRGWSQYSLDAIEPQVERELIERRRQMAAAQQNARRRASIDGQGGAHVRSESLLQPYPPGHSLFDAMLTPASGGGLSGVLSPNPDAAAAATFQSQRPNAKRARLDAAGAHSGIDRPPSLPQSALKHKRQPSQGHVSFGKMPSRPPTGPQTAPIQYRPVSTSDPHFATSATEYVEAANALTSFTRSQSAGPIEAQAPVNGVKRPASTSAVTAMKDGEERESAAELMLFLAHSPSPPRTKRMPVVATGADLGLPVEMLQPRRLFGEDEGAGTPKAPLTARSSAAVATTLAPTTGVQENAAISPIEPRPSPARVQMSSSTVTSQPLLARAKVPASSTSSLAGAFDLDYPHRVAGQPTAAAASGIW